MENAKKRQSISLYPTEQYIVAQIANRLCEGNESLAVRHIIREWARQNGITVPVAGDYPNPGNGRAIHTPSV